MFRVQEFLSELGMTKIGSFGYKFTESSIFISFIERKYNQPRNPEIAFFDECLDRRKSKKDAIFITAIENETYEMIKNPDPEPDNKGPYFYQHFPSLLKDPKPLSEADI